MSDYLNRLIEKAKGFQWDENVAPPVRDQETAVHSDAFDHLSYEMLTDAAPKLRESIEEVKQDHDYVEPAYEDLFNLLHQGDPMFKDADTMKTGYDANHQMLSELSATDEFQQLREQTAYDEWNTAFAMLAMQGDMIEQFERVQERRKAQQEAQGAAQAAQQGLQQAIDQASQPGADPAAAGAALGQATQAAQAAQAALDQATQQVQDQAAQAAQGLAQQAQQASEDIDEASQVCAGFGVDPGELKRMPFEERKALLARLDNDKIRQMAKLFGAWRMYADAQRRRKLKHQPGDVVDVRLGDDLAKLVPEEWSRIAVPELEDLFWLNYVQRGLMEWQTEGKEKAGQGPIMVVCDESGSMGAGVGSSGATREMWSKALAMALCDQAKRGKRDFIYIGFSSHGQVWEKHFPGGNITLDDVLDFVTHFFGGGTSYEAPLDRARQIIESYDKSGKPKPDVVFITDDDCRISQAFVDSWQAVKHDTDMTCYGVQIGVAKTSNAMHLLCDKTILLTALNANPSGMSELFLTI